jgi:hypothetical protein
VFVQTQTRQVDDLEITCTPLDAIEASVLLNTKLLKVFVPVFASMSEVDADASVGALVPAIAMGMAQLSETEVEAITLKLLGNCVAEGEIAGKRQRMDLNSKLKINTVFTDRLGAMYKCMQFALEVNYRGFLGALGLS